MIDVPFRMVPKIFCGAPLGAVMLGQLKLLERKSAVYI